MWTAEILVDAIGQHPDAAADAFAAVMLDSDRPPRLSSAALTALARIRAPDQPPGRTWVDVLELRGELPSFARALAARGVPLEFGEMTFEERVAEAEKAKAEAAAAAPLEAAAPVAAAAGAVADPSPLASPFGPPSIDASNLAPDQVRFIGKASNFRCRISGGAAGGFLGSGVLIGPTTVLTAWHVIARAAPASLSDPWYWQNIKVELSDGQIRDVRWPPLAASECSDDEFAQRIPANDSIVDKKSDYAVLRLIRPAGALLGSAPLPPEPPALAANSAMFLVHSPQGADFFGIGVVGQFRNLSARLAHSIFTQGGSSGGGCFDVAGRLTGIHQGAASGRKEDGGRMVPLSRFYDDVSRIVADDHMPPRMWSLDGTHLGEFVIGRQNFFEAFARARDPGPVRGIRVKRANAAGDQGGLAFSYKMLDRMIARTPDTRLCRISFEVLVADLAEEIARRARDTGVDIGTLPPDAASLTPEDRAAARARIVAEELDKHAAALGLQLWLFIDHPAIAFSNEMRAALDGFLDAALHQTHLRLVIAGFEAVPLPGIEFSDPPAPDANAIPGWMVDVISDFGDKDVRLFIEDAAEAAHFPLGSGGELPQWLVRQSLKGLDGVNGKYAPWLAGQLGERLRPVVADFFGAA